jgi:hypothetical protein
MKLLPRLLVIALLSLGAMQAADLDVKPADTISSILTRQVGQVVELRLASGEKIGGKVEKVGEKVVQLVQLTGQEFFEAAVDLDEVAAVVVRSKAK